MNLDLLSQNLLLLTCVAFTAVSMYLVIRLFMTERVKGRKKRNAAKRIFWRKARIITGAVIGSFVAAFLLQLLFASLTENQLPDSFLFMLLPLTLSVALLVLTLWMKKGLWVLAVGCMVLGVVFSSVIVNNYYRYYPTLGELFNINSNVETIDQGQRGIFFNFSHPSSNAKEKSSIEEELSSISGQRTAGKLYSLKIPGRVSEFNARNSFVYVPAAYNRLTSLNFPVVVLLPGVPGAPENWVGTGLDSIMNQFASSHNGITPLVFVVDDTGSFSDDTECVNSVRGTAETYLTTDVPTYIKAHFRVINSPDNWAIGGLSMGGMCSVMLTLRHTNVYHYFMDYSGEIGPEVGSKEKTIAILFKGSGSAWAAHQPALLLKSKKYKNMGLGGFYGVGNQDTRAVTQAISQLEVASQKAGIETVSESINGSHTFKVWQQLFKDSLPWVSNRVGATECNTVCI